jgi:hypothetical protein
VEDPIRRQHIQSAHQPSPNLAKGTNVSCPDRQQAASVANPLDPAPNAAAHTAHVNHAIKTLITLLAQQAARECSQSEHQHKDDTL